MFAIIADQDGEYWSLGIQHEHEVFSTYNLAIDYINEELDDWLDMGFPSDSIEELLKSGNLRIVEVTLVEDAE